jgi:hypothetical protein
MGGRVPVFAEDDDADDPSNDDDEPLAFNPVGVLPPLRVLLTPIGPQTTQAADGTDEPPPTSRPSLTAEDDPDKARKPTDTGVPKAESTQPHDFDEKLETSTFEIGEAEEEPIEIVESRSIPAMCRMTSSWR